MWWWEWKIGATITFVVGYVMLIIGLSFLTNGIAHEDRPGLGLSDDGYVPQAKRAAAKEMEMTKSEMDGK
jgi:hypothetical protein